MKFYVTFLNINVTLSLPSRERGLKSVDVPADAPEVVVAPFAGAWIEILTFKGINFQLN